MINLLRATARKEKCELGHFSAWPNEQPAGEQSNVAPEACRCPCPSLINRVRATAGLLPSALQSGGPDRWASHSCHSATALHTLHGPGVTTSIDLRTRCPSGLVMGFHFSCMVYRETEKGQSIPDSPVMAPGHHINCISVVYVWIKQSSISRNVGLLGECQCTNEHFCQISHRLSYSLYEPEPKGSSTVL